MAIDYSKFDKEVDLDGLKQDIQDAKDGKKKNNGEKVEIPLGTYDVEVTDMELGETGKDSKNPGSPKVKIEFEITAGKYEGLRIWMHQPITQGFQIHLTNQVLRGLAPDMEVEFVSYAQYGKLIDDIFKAIDGVYSYDLVYGEDKKFKTYTIQNRYELD